MAGAGGPLGTGARSPFPALPRWRRGRPGARGDPLMGTRWLAIDTATDIASVALGEPPGTDAGVFVQGPRRHAAEIIVLIDHALEQAGVRLTDLEGIVVGDGPDRKSTRLNSSHDQISYAVFCLKKKKNANRQDNADNRSHICDTLTL